MSKDVRSAKARLAVSIRHHPNRDHRDLRRDLAAANLEDYVSRVVAEAPPLTNSQRDRIAGLLRPVGGGDAA